MLRLRLSLDGEEHFATPRRPGDFKAESFKAASARRAGTGFAARALEALGRNVPRAVFPARFPLKRGCFQNSIPLFWKPGCGASVTMPSPALGKNSRVPVSALSCPHEHIALEIIASGEVNSPCDNLAARIFRQIPAGRIAHFQWQFAHGLKMDHDFRKKSAALKMMSPKMMSHCRSP